MGDNSYMIVTSIFKLLGHVYILGMIKWLYIRTIGRLGLIYDK